VALLRIKSSRAPEPVRGETTMEEVTLDRPADGVARVTINRPEARNALSMAVRERLALLFDELAVEEGMRAFLDKRKSQYRGT
jgi:hypothetical protein